MSTDTTPTTDRTAVSHDQDQPSIEADDPHALVTEYRHRSEGVYHTRYCPSAQVLSDPDRVPAADMAARDGWAACEHCQSPTVGKTGPRTWPAAGDPIAVRDDGTITAAHRPDDGVADVTLGHRAECHLEPHARALGTLPAPGVVFVRAHVSHLSESLWSKCWAHGLLYDHGYVNDIAGIGPDKEYRSDRPHVVEVPQTVHDEVQSILATLPAHPCAEAGHSGVRTVDADDPDRGYTCTDDDCDERFGRATAERIVGGDGT